MPVLTVVSVFVPDRPSPAPSGAMECKDAPPERGAEPARYARPVEEFWEEIGRRAPSRSPLPWRVSAAAWLVGDRVSVTLGCPGGGRGEQKGVAPTARSASAACACMGPDCALRRAGRAGRA